MTFELALKDACKRFTPDKSRKGVARDFRRHFPVLYVSEPIERETYQGKHIEYSVSLPGPNLWFRRHGDYESPHWITGGQVQFGSDEQIEEAKRIWSRGCGRDGIVRVLVGPERVQVSFDTYLKIPGSWERSKTMGETVYNNSNHGRIRHVWTEGFSRFRQDPPHICGEKDFPEMHIVIPDSGLVSKLSVLRENPHEFNEATLGDGAIDQFLLHTDYFNDLRSIVR